MILWLIIFCASFFGYSSKCMTTFGYSIPKPQIDVLSPKGFRFSIPDQDDPGIVLLAFHGRINTNFIGSEPGDISGEAKPDTDGNWVYENTKTLLKPGDVLHYWIYVQHKQLGYRLDDQRFIIPDTGTKQSTKEIPRSTSSSPIYTRPILTTKSTTTTSTTQDTCLPSITKINSGKSVCQGDLIFDENFTALNLGNTWEHQIKIPTDAEDAEFVSYQDNADVCFVENENLVIAPKLLTELPDFTEERVRAGELNLGSKCTEVNDTDSETCKRSAQLFRILPPIVSCKLRTKNSFSFKYGKIEIRTKFPKGDWIFPQLYLDPLENSYGTKPYANGQMRIGFIRSNKILTSSDFEAIGGNRLCGGVILVHGERFRREWIKTTLQERHLGNEFHKYSLTWTDNEITMALDDVPYGTLKGNFKDSAIDKNIQSAHQWSDSNMAPFDKEFYISVGVGVGGIADFPDGSRTGLQNLLKPWSNTSPKAELKFWNDKNRWYNTWNQTNYKLRIDSIKVWAI